MKTNLNACKNVQADNKIRDEVKWIEEDEHINALSKIISTSGADISSNIIYEIIARRLDYWKKLYDSEKKFKKKRSF